MKSFVFPGNIEPEILEIGARQIPYMRTQEFSSIVKNTEEMLLSFIDNEDGKAIVYTASGTGAMDAVVANYVVTKRKALIVDGGAFGHRWFEMCEYYGCPNYHYVVPFAENIDYADLENEIVLEHPDVLLCQHHETSTGQLFDIQKIAAICSKYNVSLVVDVISSFLADPLKMRKLGIDICITSTQKGLNIPPGLSIIFLSQRLLKYDFKHNSFYFDLQTNLDNLQRGQTPYSPATTLFFQTHKRCEKIKDLGVDNQIQLVEKRASCFRYFCANYGWQIPAESPSNAITGFFVNNNGNKVFRRLIEEYNTYIMPGSIKNFFRVSHMGNQTESDLEELARTIKKITE